MEVLTEGIGTNIFTIAVVDDSNEILSILEWLLRREGYEVHAFTQGQTALQFSTQNTVDLVLTDYHMPDMNGVELANALRRSGWKGSLLFMSGHVAELKANGLESLHVSGILKKPFDLVELSESVAEALREQGVRM